MKNSRGRAALISAVGSDAYLCEPLERRVLLAFEDPVIVVTEALSFTILGGVTAQTVRPRLWENSGEFLWDIGQPNSWNTTDGDGNTYPDDAYGWNFLDLSQTPPQPSPNFIYNGPLGPLGAHG